MGIADKEIRAHCYVKFIALKGSGSELRSCVKVEVAVLGSPSLTDLMVNKSWKPCHRGRKATLNLNLG